MNVTFLIGNGFDLACGLKTSYSDFIEYYLAERTSSDTVKLFKENIEKNLETWADAEIAFGRYTEEYTFETISHFQECYDDFLKYLANYLTKQEQRILAKDIPPLAFADFIGGLLNFDMSVQEPFKKAIDNLLYNGRDFRRNINILTFNYTSVFEEILNRSTSRNRTLSSITRNGMEYSNRIDSFNYVHSKINEPLIFGVDNPDQITNTELLENPYFLYAMVKPESNSKMRKHVVQHCEQAINDSSVICIYGMSIGLTDSFWWSKIIDWLREDKSHLLIYFAWSGTYIRASTWSHHNNYDVCRERFYSNLRLSQNDSDALRDQIHIELNVDLFGVDKTIRPLIDTDPLKIANVTPALTRVAQIKK